MAQWNRISKYHQYLLSPSVLFLYEPIPVWHSITSLLQIYIDKTKFSLYFLTLRIHCKSNHLSSLSAFTLGHHSLCSPVFCKVVGYLNQGLEKTNGGLKHGWGKSQYKGILLNWLLLQTNDGLIIQHNLRSPMECITEYPFGEILLLSQGCDLQDVNPSRYNNCKCVSNQRVLAICTIDRVTREASERCFLS